MRERGAPLLLLGSQAEAELPPGGSRGGSGDPPAFSAHFLHKVSGAAARRRLPWKPACSGSPAFPGSRTTESPPCWPGAPALTRQGVARPRQAGSEDLRAARPTARALRDAAGAEGSLDVRIRARPPRASEADRLISDKEFLGRNAVHAKLDKYVRIRKRIANDGLILADSWTWNQS